LQTECQVIFEPILTICYQVMFKYSCSGMHLTNWVLSQVSNQPGVVFPQKKGWSFQLKVFYPAGSDKSALMILVVCENECIAFLPIDETIDALQIKSAINLKRNGDFLADFKQVSVQQILLTCEKQHDRVRALLGELNVKTPLLVLSSEEVIFSHGNFENSRLEFRLSQVEYDPDMISGFVYDNRLKSGENIQKSLFYQQLFHRLNRLWLQGEKRVALRSLVSRSVPCWNNFRRSDQKDILGRINTDLQAVFTRFFENLIFLQTYQKKVSSQPELMIMFPESPKTRKSMSSWSRKQKSALEYLHESAKPISMDELQLPFR
jgi:hypothetical protein